MWLRGRTVLALTALAAIIGGTTAWAWMKAGGMEAFVRQTPARYVTETNAAEGLRQDEIDKLNKALELIGERYMLPANRQALIDGALRGLVESLDDPYSVYLTKEEAAQFTDSTQGTFTGIGADLKKENGLIVVEAPLRGSPAERAGLQPMDVLLAVNGISLHDMSLNEAAAKIRGPKGTKAKLSVLRPGVKDPIELELVRERISLETVKSEMASDGIGLLTISQFSQNTPHDVETALKDLEQRGLQALIIDVRNNPGGMTEAVQKTADLFIPTGKGIVQYEYGDGKRTQHTATGKVGATGKSYPLLVLINRASASSAEILAGALQQSANALLIGDRSFGKGTVQISYPDDLGDGSLVKLTVYKWLLPDGGWVQSEGLVPDVPVEQRDFWLAYKLPRNHVLKLDDIGEDVKNLQVILSGIGFEPDRKDGYFSAETEHALKRYQQQAELPITGQVDSDTAERLEESLYAAVHNPANDEQLQVAINKARSLLGLAAASQLESTGGRNWGPFVEYVGGLA